MPILLFIYLFIYLFMYLFNMLYGLEALLLSKLQLSSVNFTVNRFLMKLFTSIDIQTIELRRLQFNLKLYRVNRLHYIVARNLLALNM